VGEAINSEFLKVNSDGAFTPGTGEGVWGVVIRVRDDQGSVIKGRCCAMHILAGCFACGDGGLSDGSENGSRIGDQ
jgi:hypothetical protein